MKENRVKEIMSDIFDFPHIPYWFSIGQAIRIVRVSFIDVKKYLDPVAILVFDEKYTLRGTLSLKDIMKGLEPGLASGEAAQDGGLEYGDWQKLFSHEATARSESPVSDIMTPFAGFIRPEEPVQKAVFLMLRHDLLLLPVLENGKKLVGIVRTIDAFDAVTAAMMK
jgi:CBS-domain-containing membrane protein